MVPYTCWFARVTVVPLPIATELSKFALAPDPIATALAPVTETLLPTATPLAPVTVLVLPITTAVRGLLARERILKRRPSRRRVHQDACEG